MFTILWWQERNNFVTSFHSVCTFLYTFIVYSDNLDAHEKPGEEQ